MKHTKNYQDFISEANKTSGKTKIDLNNPDWQVVFKDIVDFTLINQHEVPPGTEPSDYVRQFVKEYKNYYK
jgi:hypothetical protein